MPRKKAATGIRRHGSKFEWSFMYKGKRYFGSADTEAEAIAAKLARMEEVKKEHEEGKARASITTLQQAYELTLSVKWEGTKGATTSKINSQTAISYFGADKDIRDIDSLAVAAYIKHLRTKGLEEGTINRKTTALRTILRIAQEHGLLTKVPKIQRQKEYHGRIRIVTEKEEAEFIGHLETAGLWDFKDVFNVLIDTGLRTGELLKLRVKDLQFRADGTGKIQVWHTKADLARSVPMTKRVYEILQRRASQANGSGTHVFPYKQQWIRTYWNKIKRYMGLVKDKEDKEFVPHCLRHTTATRLLQRGVSIIEVKNWLGHRSLKTTERYLHLGDEEHLQRACEKLEGKKIVTLLAEAV